MAEKALRTRTFFDGDWFEGEKPLIGPRSHAMWLASTVFDGARWFEGLTPDLDLHCERVNRSARAMGLKPTVAAREIERLAHEGLQGFDGEIAVYIRPMYWAEAGGFMGVPADPDSTRFCLCLYEAPMTVSEGFTLGVSPYRRPSPETAPTDAKAGCLYPQSGRAIMEARSRGYDNALLTDLLGNVAETATSNVFLVKDGIVRTPQPNGTFLNGITRQRVIALLRGAGHTVEEVRLTVSDFMEADEIFSTGNFAKVVPVTGLEGWRLERGPVCELARDLYWKFARSNA